MVKGLSASLLTTAVTIILLFSLPGCSKVEPAAYEDGEKWPGGKTSVTVSGKSSFSRASANMAANRRLDFSVGDSFFKSDWVAAPQPDSFRDGLGPLFNTRSCEGCHILDGRGHAPADGELNEKGLLVRISVPATTQKEKEQLTRSGVIPHPVYGDQIQDFSLEGVKHEAKVRVRYEYSTIRFSDGESVQIRKPVVLLEDLNYGPLPDNLMISPRIASPMIGLGLLEAISDSQILANEDPDDRDGDGISGRGNRVWDIKNKKTALGRFGWKAGQPNMTQQSAGAFNGDMGITSSLFPDDNCTESQTACKAATPEDHPDVSDSILEKVVFYSRNLAVPIRLDSKDPEVLKGKALFGKARCSGCHIPNFTTLKVKNYPEQSEQSIWPYTDLLLHDMGEGLADNRPEFLASGREWRTPPLWGIGKSKMVNPKATFLHDGRARTIMEAILWHGGEGEAAKQAVMDMNKEQRTALVRFVNSL